MDINTGLGNSVFYDLNANGIQDEGEFGAGNVIIKLLYPDGSAVLDSNGQPITTTSAGDGTYSFTGIAAGEYKVQFVAPEGFTFTNANVGNDEALDSDANPFNNGITQTVVITDGAFNDILDAGLVRPAGIGNLVFEDFNANGIQDAGEQGIAGVEVQLLADTDNDGQIDDVVTTTTTDADGSYAFTGLTNGDYRVMFVQPDGYDTVSPFKAGYDATLDSDANPDNNLVSDVVSLDPGVFNNQIDAGFFQKAPGFGGVVSLDGNANGLQDDGEYRAAGVVVKLLNADGSAALDSDGNAITTTTNNDGAYNFFNLTPGEYQVQFVAPAGFTFTNANVGSDEALDSDANPLNNGITQTVTIADGDFIDTIDAGLVRPAGLGSLVFHDLNGNGVQDTGEQGIAGAEVRLLSDTDNDGAIDDVIATTTTAADGTYAFNNLTPGDFRVQFVQPEGFDNISPFQAGFDSSLDSDANPAANLTSDVVTLNQGVINSQIDAGFSNTVSIGDRVWFDTNGNGSQDDGEVGIEGIEVTLTGGGADQRLGTADDTTVTTLTDINGNYHFEGLNAGEEYQVTVGLPNNDNLVANGSFETNNTNINQWTLQRGLAEWQITGANRTEVQELVNRFGAADEGTSWVELDAAKNTGIAQQLDTRAGEVYELSFAYTGRPGVSAESNTIEVYWDGELLDTISESGIGQSQSQWQTYTYRVQGSDAATTGLEFRAAGSSDGLGGFLDDVSVTRPTNLVSNGSFETNNTNVNQWKLQSGLTGWQITGANRTEVQELVSKFGAADEGTSWVELDAAKNTGIAQQLDTRAGEVYELSFAYTARPGVRAESNAIEVYWDGELLDTIVESGFGQTQNQWQTYSYKVQGANAATTGLEFRAAGSSDSLGGFLDDVQVVALDSYEFTSQNAVGDSLNSDVDATGNTDVITINSGMHMDNVDAGIRGDIETLGAVPYRPESVLMEAEDFTLSGGYRVESVNDAAISGGEVIRLVGTTGTASTQFTGETGFYQLDVAYFDENDGQALAAISVGGNLVDSFTFDQDLNGRLASAETRAVRTVSDSIFIEQGEEISLFGIRDEWELARFDSIEFTGVNTPQVNIDAEFFDFSQGVNTLSDINFSARPTYTESVDEIQHNRLRGTFFEGGSNDTFAARYSGSFDILMEGGYTFFLNSDDGSQLLINGEEVINNDGLHATREMAETIDLSLGTHTFELLYFENYGAATLELDVAGASTNNERVAFGVEAFG